MTPLSWAITNRSCSQWLPRVVHSRDSPCSINLLERLQKERKGEEKGERSWKRRETRPTARTNKQNISNELLANSLLIYSAKIERKATTMVMISCLMHCTWNEKRNKKLTKQKNDIPNIQLQTWMSEWNLTSSIINPGAFFSTLFFSLNSVSLSSLAATISSNRHCNTATVNWAHSITTILIWHLLPAHEI